MLTFDDLSDEQLQMLRKAYKHVIIQCARSATDAIVSNSCDHNNIIHWPTSAQCIADYLSLLTLETSCVRDFEVAASEAAFVDPAVRRCIMPAIKESLSFLFLPEANNITKLIFDAVLSRNTGACVELFFSTKTYSGSFEAAVYAQLSGAMSRSGATFLWNQTVLETYNSIPFVKKFLGGDIVREITAQLINDCIIPTMKKQEELIRSNPNHLGTVVFTTRIGEEGKEEEDDDDAFKCAQCVFSLSFWRR
eukprot:PhM_4_TR5452/c0_g1_i1/m.50096